MITILTPNYMLKTRGTYYPQGFLRTSTGNNAILDHTLTTTYKTDINNDFNLDVLAGLNSRDLSYNQMGVTSKDQLVFGLLDHTNFITRYRKRSGC